MNFRDWIYSFTNHVPSIISRPARWIADRMYGILNDGIKFARWIGKGAWTMAVKGIVFVAMVLSFAIEVGATLRWLVSIEIPRRVLAGLNAAKQWATPIINRLNNALLNALSLLRNWIVAQLNGIINTARQLRDWALSQVNELKNYLSNTVGRWYERLSSPSKFAEWIIGAMVTALMRYLYANRDKIARFVLNSSPSATTWLARQLESIIGRLL